MTDETGRALVRQLRLLNRWITVFGVLVLSTLAIILFLLFQVVTFVRTTTDRVQSVGESVDVRQRACSAEGAFGDFVRSQAGWCE